MTKEKLQLNRKFLVIESPIPFELYCPEQDDGVKRRQGSWQMTIHDLLTKSHYPLNPIYNLELIYDETLLAENETVSWYTTDLNLGEALRGIDGQLVTLGDSAIDANIKNFPSKFDIISVFEGFSKQGLSLYRIDKRNSFINFFSSRITINVNFNSYFYFSKSDGSAIYLYKDFKLFEYKYNTDTGTLSSMEFDILKIVLDGYETADEIRFRFYYIESNTKKNILKNIYININELNFDGFIEFYL